tara:strand:- start:57 stop:1016 length:960 start_codon:yes stop_codon:yes gene_type:complete
MSVDLNFKKVFKEEFNLTMVQAVRSMFDKYFTEAYTGYQVHIIDDMILNATNGCSINHKQKDLRKKCLDKSGWMWKMKDVMLEVKTKVRTRKCNDCCKAYVDCRNTCYKPTPNPRPMEFPQDVFNVIKDYLGVYDIPEPVTELMGMMKLKNLLTRGKGPNIKKRKDLSVDERVRLYNAYVIRIAKSKVLNGPPILDIANKYPDLRFGKELTDNNKIFLLRLLFNNYYQGVWRDGSYDDYSLYDFICGDIGISSSEKIPKKPKPYVMYWIKDRINDKKHKDYDCYAAKYRVSNHYLKSLGFGCGQINRSDVIALRSFVYW